MNDEELVRAYEEELKRKDEVIERLREENEVLLRASVKAAKERLELKELLRELEGRS
ncbi:hypothetical protein JXA12_04340 [Candidatus Woesearchaeota archaeon]|nr:hypothetical protein [Candidatus Woesearchaeota archaeon]